jgi:hypothetical protein
MAWAIPQALPLRRPPNAIELRILFYSIEYVGKNEMLFFQFILVQLYQLIFTHQGDIYFWCFTSSKPFFNSPFLCSYDQYRCVWMKFRSAFIISR